MAFTAEEKARIKHFLSYPDWLSLAQSISLGYPSVSQPAFLVDDAFGRMTPETEVSIRKDLQECECCEAQMSDARSRFKATKIGKIELNHAEPAMLRNELLWWTTRLADDLGVVSNPYSQMMYQALSDVGGVSARVQ